MGIAFGLQVEGESMVTCVEEIAAGSIVDELGFYCQDEAGRPVGGSLKGRLTFSWGRSTKKVTLQDETIVQLPPLQVRQATNCLPRLSLFHIRQKRLGLVALQKCVVSNAGVS